MKILAKTESWTARDNFNAIKSQGISDNIGKVIKIQAIAVGTDFSAEDGKEIATGYIRAVDDTGVAHVYSTVSKTTIQQLSALIEMDEGEYDVKICEQRCKKDSKNAFVYLDLV